MTFEEEIPCEVTQDIKRGVIYIDFNVPVNLGEKDKIKVELHKGVFHVSILRDKPGVSGA